MVVALRKRIDRLPEYVRAIDRYTRRWWFGHLAIFLICASMVGVALMLTPSTGAVAVGGFDVPILCGFRKVTGVGCPGCGMTRSFTFMAHGEWLAAWNLNMLGPPTFIAVASQVLYRPFQLVRGYLRRR